MHRFCLSRIVRASNDRTTVAKDRQHVRCYFRSNKKWIALDRTKGLQLRFQLLQINRCGIGKGQLDGVSPTQNGRLARPVSVQPVVSGLTAGRTRCGFQGVGPQLLPLVAPDIDHRQAGLNRVPIPTGKLENLGRLKRAHDVHDRPEDSRRIARWRGPRVRRFGHQATKAGRLARNDRHHLAFRADASAVDPGQVQRVSRIVEQETRFEIVGPVGNDIYVRQHRTDVRGVDVRYNRLDVNAAVDAPQSIRRRNGLGQMVQYILLVVKHLTLKIVQLQKIAVHNFQMPDARARKRVGDYRTKGSASAHQYGRLGDPVLSRFAQAGKKRLANITPGVIK